VKTTPARDSTGSSKTKSSDSKRNTMLGTSCSLDWAIWTLDDVVTHEMPLPGAPMIPPASKFWYVRASDPDGWASGPGTAEGPTSSLGKCSICRGACSRGYKLRSREGACPRSLSVVESSYSSGVSVCCYWFCCVVVLLHSLSCLFNPFIHGTRFPLYSSRGANVQGLGWQNCILL
jgi:hypothetical protein